MLSSVFLFLNIGSGEGILIIFAALMLFGGDKLPDLARKLGKGMREFKDASEDVKREINSQINNYKDDLNSDIKIKDKATEENEQTTPLLEENTTEHALEVTEHPNYIGKNPVPNTIPVGSNAVSDENSTDAETTNTTKEEHNS